MREFEQFGDSSLDRFVRSARAGGMVRADRYVYSRTRDSATLIPVFLTSAAVAAIVTGVFAEMMDAPLLIFATLEQLPKALASQGFGLLAGGLYLWLELEIHTLEKTKVDKSTPTRDSAGQD